MKSEQLFDALADIDEKYIIEAKNEVVAQKKKYYVKWIALASCVAVVAIVALGVTKLNTQTKIPLTETKTKSEVISENVISPPGKEESTYVTGENNNGGSTLLQTTTEKTTENKKQQEENKGGDSYESIADERVDEDGGHYKVFKPGVDKFEPLDDMSLENRFCSFNYNGYSYYPAANGEITKKDYDTNKLTSVKASYWELRSANADDETNGIVYNARIDIYKLIGVDPSEAVACVISFNGETKEYKYNAK